MSEYKSIFKSNGKRWIWTPTHIDKFLQCPEQFCQTYLEQAIPFDDSANKDPNSPLGFGSIAHGHVEKRIELGIEVPEGQFKHFEVYADYWRNLAEANGLRLEPEQQVSADIGWRPGKGWRERYCYAKVDQILWLAPTHAVVGDLKTGKFKPEHVKDTQAKATAAMMFASNPDLQVVKTKWCYFDKQEAVRVQSGLPMQQVIEETYTRADDMQRLQKELDAIYESVYRAYQHQNWRKKESALCAWCPVKTCENNPG